ncbi:MAG: AAA family ATPase [Dehalococcoidia bacterium]|nr:AAA family ATPase [Dehalococcoidia bacterium]
MEQYTVNLNHTNSVGNFAAGSPVESLVELNDVSTDRAAHMATGIKEFDRVIGGGFVVGSTTLLAGDPGIGKSTLLLQAAAAIAKQGKKFCTLLAKKDWNRFVYEVCA